MTQSAHHSGFARRLRMPLLGVIVIAFAGCSVHEIHSPIAPPVDTPDRFPSGDRRISASQTSPLIGRAWWLEFDDPRLTSLITESFATNLTAADFAARVVAARALARQAGADRRPAIDATGSAGFVSSNESALADAVTELDFRGEVGISASWEVDVFGRLRNRERAAVADALAAEDDLNAIFLTLSADIASAYYSAIEQRLLIALLEAQIDRDVTLLELIELRFAQGEATGLDLLRQRAQLADARALIPGARAALRDAENTMDALAGIAADGQDRASGDLPELPRVPAAGVPADLLINRPDLRAARRRLLAVDFRIGEAIADRLPRFDVVGSLAYADAPGGSGFAASALGGVFAPLIDWGRRQAVVDERRADYASLLAQWASLYVDAIAEVDTLLHAERRTRDRIEVLTDRVDLLDRAVIEARNRYVNGIGDYTDVLVALDDLQETQRELLAARAGLIQQRIRVYRAAGGGFGGNANDPENLILQADTETTP